jgi:hypothetical protein
MEKIHQFYLPQMYSPVTYRHCPLASDATIIDEVSRWAQEWMPSKHLDDHIGTGLRYASLYCPDCTHRSRFIVMVEAMALIAAFDDQDVVGDDSLIDSAQDRRSFAEQTRAALEIHEGTSTARTRTEQAFQRCVDGVRATCIPWVAQRYVAGVAEWLQSMCNVHARTKRNTMSFAEVVEFRLADGAGVFTASQLEGLLDFDLEAVWSEVEDLWRLAFGAMILTNDIYSFRREYYYNDTTSALFSLHLNEGMPFQHAVDYLATFIDDRVHRFQQQWPQRLATFPLPMQPEMERYFRAVEQTIAGNLYLQRTAPRYHGPGLTEPVPAGLLIMDPKRTIVIPTTREIK